MEKIDKLKDTNLHINMNCNREDMIIFYRFNNRFILNYKNKIIFEKGLNDHLINKKYSYFKNILKLIFTMFLLIYIQKFFTNCTNLKLVCLLLTAHTKTDTMGS